MGSSRRGQREFMAGRAAPIVVSSRVSDGRARMFRRVDRILSLRDLSSPAITGNHLGVGKCDPFARAENRCCDWPAAVLAGTGRARGLAALPRDAVELEIRGAVSFVHRIADVFGLPIWFTHSLRKITRQGETCLYGCLVPIQGRSRIFALNPDTVARFIHKLGNHFQLLNLVASSLKKALPDSREHEILDQTLDNAIDLTRIFSDCNQVPSLTS